MINAEGEVMIVKFEGTASEVYAEITAFAKLIETKGTSEMGELMRKPLEPLIPLTGEPVDEEIKVSGELPQKSEKRACPFCGIYGRNGKNIRSDHVKSCKLNPDRVPGNDRLKAWRDAKKLSDTSPTSEGTTSQASERDGRGPGEL